MLSEVYFRNISNDDLSFPHLLCMQDIEEAWFLLPAWFWEPMVTSDLRGKTHTGVKGLKNWNLWGFIVFYTFSLKEQLEFLTLTQTKQERSP